MKAFVTGGTGFIGINLINELLQDGWQVSVLHRKTSDLSRLAKLEVELEEGDITDQEQMETIIKNGAFDAVFHVAGDVSLWKLRNPLQDEINIVGTRTLARLALKHEVKRFIHTSTVSVWGLQEGTLNESTEKLGGEAPINYMRSKFFGEQEVLACSEEGLDAVILNPCHVMGPFDEQNWAQLFFLIKEGKLPGVPPGMGTYCHVREVAKAHVKAFYKGQKGHCYLLGGEQASYVQVGKKIADLVAERAPSQLPRWFLATVGKFSEGVGWMTGKEPTMTPEKAALLSHDVKVDCSKAKNELGYREIPLDKILEESHQWLHGEGLV